ncbi:MAG: FliH/SctL family protein [Terriglobales bacterium]
MSSEAQMGAHHIEAFVYRESARLSEIGEALPVAEPAAVAFPTVSEDQAGAREQEARRQGAENARREMEEHWQREMERALEGERGQVAAALAAFARQRQDYFRQLEREVVQLALGVAKKVLHREAQIDPLLLAATVRVALDQLAGGAKLELVVPPSKLRQWQELMQRDLEIKAQPVLRADAALEPSGCKLVTETGATDLGLESQLREVEQGFLDLLDRRQRATGPDTAAAAAAS